MQKRKMLKRSGFTLIELLIVIGLLGALTALVLPSLSADREDAIGNVCDFNQAGTVRTLKQFKQLTGVYPDDMHTGIQSNGSDAVAMLGLPDAQEDHMGNAGAATPETCPSLHVLSANEAASLKAAGIDSICYNTGLDSDDILTAGGDYVVCAADGTVDVWKDDGDPAAEMTFDGVTLTEWCSSATAPDEKNGIVVVFWIAPTTDWTLDQENANKDWGGGNVELGLDVEGQCPVPLASVDGGEVAFAYYMAYFKVYSDGTTPAKLIGTTCPECGVMNP